MLLWEWLHQNKGLCNRACPFLILHQQLLQHQVQVRLKNLSMCGLIAVVKQQRLVLFLTINVQIVEFNIRLAVVICARNINSKKIQTSMAVYGHSYLVLRLSLTMVERQPLLFHYSKSRYGASLRISSAVNEGNCLNSSAERIKPACCLYSVMCFAWA